MIQPSTEWDCNRPKDDPPTCPGRIVRGCPRTLHTKLTSTALQAGLLLIQRNVHSMALINFVANFFFRLIELACFALCFEFPNNLLEHLNRLQATLSFVSLHMQLHAP